MPISVCDWNLFSLMDFKFSRMVSNMLVVSSYLEPNLSCERVCVDYSLNGKYIRLVVASVLISGKIG